VRPRQAETRQVWDKVDFSLHAATPNSAQQGRRQMLGSLIEVLTVHD
jgi:hypothetical protein|tara:strand:- start:2583 stop:2723 length:141 start_codon:yes stop_codon:yes gene_type:complete